MASSPWPHTPGGYPLPPEAAAAVAAAATAAATPVPTSEQHSVKEGANSAAAAVPQQEEEEVKPHLPRDDDSETVIQEHEQKINRYQAILAARLKAKFFSKKCFYGGNNFESNTIIEGETIQSSRWPCTRSFVNPEFLSRDEQDEKGNSPSSAADSSAKNNSPPLAGEASPKNNASALTIENNLTPGKRQQSKKT